LSPEITTIDGTVVVALPRRLDADSAPRVEAELKPIIANNPQRLLFDLARTEYVASTGMRVLLAAAHAIRAAGGSVALSTLNRQVEYVLEITGFMKIFTTFPSREKALEEMQGGR
jgi:anti-sigma B factor antagonist